MRLFVAVDPSVEAVAHLAAALDVGSARPTPMNTWHITLVFCGEVDASTAERLRQGLAGVASASAPVDLRLRGAGVFGAAMWVGVEGDLAGLARDAAAAAWDCGIGVEDRPFRGHLTVGRTSDRVLGRRWVGEMAAYAGPAWQAAELRLVRSCLGRGPVRHETVESWRLGR